MLDPLGGRNEARVAHFIVGFLFDHFLALLEDAFHAFALRTASGLAVAFKDFLESHRMLFRLFKMLLKAGSELLIGRRFDHLRQRLDDLLFGTIEILKFLNIKAFESLKFHGIRINCF
jgi:hypothetical protein